MADPLVSWLPCPATAAILDFVRFITEAGKSFMPQPIDEDPDNPVHIWTRTGCKPLLAGNVNRCGARPGGTIGGRWGQECPLGGSPG